MPVARLHEAAPEFESAAEQVTELRFEAEQRAGVEAFHAALGDHLAGARRAIRTGNLSLLGVPQHDMVVPGVEAVEVAPCTGALADGTERKLAQPSDLLQQRRVAGQAAGV